MHLAAPPHRDEGPRSKRTAILRAAIDCFGETGYDATKWSTVAHRVGIGQTALYHYFESKAHCLLTIMRLELQRSHERFLVETGPQLSAEQALRGAVRAAFDVSDTEVLQNRVLQDNLGLLSGTRASEREEVQRAAARELVHQIEGSWTALLSRGMTAGDFPRRDARLLAMSATGMVVSVWRWYRPGGPVGLGEVADSVEGSVVRMVMA